MADTTASTPLGRVASTPYPWPWSGELRPERSSLLVVSSPGRPDDAGAGPLAPPGRVAPLGPSGQSASPGSRGALDLLRDRLTAFAETIVPHGVLVVQVCTAFAEHAGREARLPDGGAHAPGPLVPVPDAASTAGTTPQVLHAAGLDGFFGTALDHLLRRHQRDQLLLAGTWLETGVHSTMRSANDRGYECLLLSDLTVPASPGLRAGALSSIEMSGGIFGAVATSSDYANALTHRGATTS